MKVYFPRACILAIYGDHPAAAKCALTGSACLVCFAKQNDFAATPAPGTMEKRHGENMKKRKRILVFMSNSGVVGANKRAIDRANQIGVNLDVDCAWINEHLYEWVFGPCRKRDVLYQCLPQVNLHGFDEGLVEKLNFGALEQLIVVCVARFRMKATQVTPALLLHA